MWLVWAPPDHRERSLGCLLMGSWCFEEIAIVSNGEVLVGDREV